jgi:hypothetical protein
LLVAGIGRRGFVATRAVRPQTGIGPFTTDPGEAAIAEEAHLQSTASINPSAGLRNNAEVVSSFSPAPATTQRSGNRNLLPYHLG